LADRHGEAGFLCCTAPEYVERLDHGVTLMGADCNAERNSGRALAMMADYDPTHLIVHGPITPLLRWGLRRGIKVGCVLADSFAMHPLDCWLRFGRLAGVLNDPG
jgi:hypothetical protein